MDSNKLGWPEPRVDYAQTIIIQIASNCDFETPETFDNNLDHYEANDFSYIPLPAHGKYFDRESSSLKELQPEQWVWLENPLVPEFSRFEDHDFLLIYRPEKWFFVGDSGVETIDPGSVDPSTSQAYPNPYELVDDWPEYREDVYDILQELDCLYIVTLADLNDRRLKASLYHLISSVEVVLSYAVEEIHPDEEDLIKRMGSTSVGRWKKAEYNVGQLHPTEYMGFGELKDCASRSPEIREALGYDGKGDFNHNLNEAKDIRNMVMHPTRNLIRDRSDVEEISTAVDQLEDFIERSGGTIYRGN